MAASLVSPLGNAFQNKYAEELIATARAITAPGKGILAADESTGTIGKRVSLFVCGRGRSCRTGWSCMQRPAARCGLSLGSLD